MQTWKDKPIHPKIYWKWIYCINRPTQLLNFLMNLMIKMINLTDIIDWYFSSWQLSMPLEFLWQLSVWVGPLSSSSFIIELRACLILFNIWIWYPPPEVCSFFQADVWHHMRPKRPVSTYVERNSIPLKVH